jgi:arylsulfatase A-like enzyme
LVPPKSVHSVMTPWISPGAVALTAIGITAMIILAGCCLLPGPVCAEDGSSVILIIIDTVRADHLGCYGYERETSPNIDAFSKECVFFKKAIAAAPWTTPAIASMFTGQYPRVLGYEAEAVVVDDKVLCLAEIFRNAGYATAGVISHIFVSSELGFDQGFDSYDEENAQGHGHISSPSVTDKGIAFVDTHKGKRFFLFLHYFDPHCDYILHDQYNFFPGYDGELYSGEPIEDLRQAAPHMTAEDRRYLNALYDSEIRFTDEHIGRLFQHLKDIGIYEDLTIVVVADHGEAFLERGDDWIGHTKTVYQELIHVPFMIRLPGESEGWSVDRNISLLDFMPTVVAASGLDVPEGYEHDAVNLLDGSGAAGREYVFSETGRWGRQEALLDGDWKVISDQIAGTISLFNLGSDPGELRDVSGENDEVLRRLRAKLFELDYDLRMARSRFRVRAPKLSPEQVEKLRSLGYIR